MFPMVPYYNLPELHKVLLPQMPKPYTSMYEVYCEMIPALIKQGTDPDYYIERPLPTPLAPEPEAENSTEKESSMMPDENGWVMACTVDEVAKGDVTRFDCGPRSYCVYHAEDDGKFYATAGKCTHGAADLGDGLVTGNLIECPKHNGCFDFKTGEPKRLPVRQRLATFPVRVEGQNVYVQVGGGTSSSHIEISYENQD